MIVESGNPAALGRRQPADARGDAGARRRASCIDVFMTETARQSDYVLPAATQYEKFEATFFNFDFPKNVFHLRRPVLDPPRRSAARAGDPRPHRRGPRPPRPRRRSSRCGPAAEREPRRVRGGVRRGDHHRSEARPPSPPVLLYRTLGPTLPHGAAAAACAVADGDPLRADQPRRRRPCRVRLGTRRRQPAVRRDPLGGDDLRRAAPRASSGATPAFCASAPTATAISTATSRTSVRAGSSGASGPSGPASWLPAPSRRRPSCRRSRGVAPEARTPSPSAGKM